MITTNYIWVSLWAILPILMYSYMVYVWIPARYISPKRARSYLFAGMLAPMLIFLIHFLFPWWGEKFSDNQFLSFLIYAFFQVAILEELTKYITFQWVSSERKSEKYDLPIAIMFYSMMTSVGFAIVENISYLIDTRQQIILNLNYLQNNSHGSIVYDSASIYKLINDSLMNVSLIRALSAVVVHMIAGVILGYFMVKSHNVKYRLCQSDTSILILRTKRIGYIIMGIIAAASFHGLYDLNLLLPNNQYALLFHIVNVIVGLIIGNFIIKDLIESSKKIKNKL